MQRRPPTPDAGKKRRSRPDRRRCRALAGVSEFVVVTVGVAVVQVNKVPGVPNALA